jgi:hypothetical protein
MLIANHPGRGDQVTTEPEHSPPSTEVMRLRDPGFRRFKTDPLLAPLRKELRFQAIERALKFPPL